MEFTAARVRHQGVAAKTSQPKPQWESASRKSPPELRDCLAGVPALIFNLS
jgi:hypothetical protein